MWGTCESVWGRIGQGGEWGSDGGKNLLLIPMFSYFSSVFWKDPLYRKEKAEVGLEAGQKRVQPVWGWFSVYGWLRGDTVTS